MSILITVITGSIFNQRKLQVFLFLMLLALSISLSAQKSDNNTCAPKDTLIEFDSDLFFVRHVWLNDTFQVHFGKNSFDTCFPFEYTCNSVFSAIPTFSWCTDRIMSFSRGCGASCWINYYFNFSQKKLIEREFVIATDSIKLIVYSENSKGLEYIVIENILTGEILKFVLDSSANIAPVYGGASVYGCIEKVEFLNESLIVFYWKKGDPNDILKKKVYNY